MCWAVYWYFNIAYVQWTELFVLLFSHNKFIHVWIKQDHYTCLSVRLKTKRPSMCESANNVIKSPSEISSGKNFSQHESPCIYQAGWRCLHGRFQCFYTLFDFGNVDSDNSDRTNKHTKLQGRKQLHWLLATNYIVAKFIIGAKMFSKFSREKPDEWLVQLQEIHLFQNLHMEI